ncbi:ribonuclease P protein subunit p30 [Leptidea sinapis]|uniref:ribonuclease P protein subunit p30 n=1 Tax=Leptidea sinapis TaxID=189913 RepID=UPI002140C186|nr:ribonuclease P protein subunit p30 [Leptidea sinapis]
MINQEWGFCDLSVSKDYDLKKLKILSGLGYNTIAIDTRVEEVVEEPKKKKKKGDTKEVIDYIPPPIEIPTELINNKLQILRRVTVEFSDSSITVKLNKSENLKKYDILAVIPKTLQAFHYACGTLDADIITFEPESKIPFKVSRKLYRLAVERGVYFELMYSPAIKDTTSRKNIISTAHNYHAVGKSKNIIITSWAENHLQVRGVHDVVNLGFIFGLNSNSGLEAIRNNPRKLILKSIGRRCGKHYMDVTSVDISENKELQN